MNEEIEKAIHHLKDTRVHELSDEDVVRLSEIIDNLVYACAPKEIHHKKAGMYNVFFTTKNDGIIEWKQFECIGECIISNKSLLLKGEDGIPKAYFPQYLYFERI